MLKGRVLLAQLFLVIIPMITPAYAEASKKQPLEFITRFKVPYFNEMAWFPDNRRVAIMSGHIRILDTVTGNVTPPVTEAKLRPPIAISPDGSVLVVGSGPGLNLYSTKNWRKLAEIDTREAAHCRSVGHRRELAFTRDSSFIWVGCSGQGSIQGAVKLTVPDLAVADTIEITEKISPASRLETHDVYVQAEPLALHILTRVYPGSQPPRPGASTPYDSFVSVIDLATKSDVLPTLALPDDEKPIRGAQDAYISSDRNFYLVYRGQRDPGAIITYDISTRDKLKQFAPLSEIGTADPSMQPEGGGHWGLSNLIPLGDGRVMAALASENRDGGLVIWDYRSGQRIQRINGPGMFRIARSPDGTRVIGLFYTELYVYSVESERSL